MDSAATIAIVGVLSATVGALIWIIKYLFTEFKPALDTLIKLSAENIKNTAQNTETTRSADLYLRERNGRDNAFHSEVMASLKDIPIQAKAQADIVVQELRNVGKLTAKTLEETNQQTITQTVVEQTVGKQVVASKESEDIK